MEINHELILKVVRGASEEFFKKYLNWNYLWEGHSSGSVADYLGKMGSEQIIIG